MGHKKNKIAISSKTSKHKYHGKSTNDGRKKKRVIGKQGK